MVRKKIIILPKRGMQGELAKECGVHRNTVAAALLGIRDSDEAELIRKRAKAAPYYGVEVKY
jgi:hypothetical protein